MKGLVLLSGGFDSAVAAHCVQKASNAELLAVHFSSAEIAGKQAEEKTIALCKKLKIDKIFLVPIAPLLKTFARDCTHAAYFVLMKRAFFFLSEKIALQNNVDFLVTGENLGQVSSQTLSNLSVIARATSLPVVRPLLGLEKNEIIALAKKIGTHDISVGPELCDILGPSKPWTRCTLLQIKTEEQKIKNLGELLNQAIEKTRRENIVKAKKTPVVA